MNGSPEHEHVGSGFGRGSCYDGKVEALGIVIKELRAKLMSQGGQVNMASGAGGPALKWTVERMEQAYAYGLCRWFIFHVWGVGSFYEAQIKWEELVYQVNCCLDVSPHKLSS